MIYCIFISIMASLYTILLCLAIKQVRREREEIFFRMARIEFLLKELYKIETNNV